MTKEELYQRNCVIVELTKAQFTPEEIAKTLDMKEGRVRRILRAAKVKAYRVSKVDKNEKALKIIECLNKGMGLSETARAVGVSRQYVFQVKNR